MNYLLDIHCHTIASGHAYSTITENAQKAAEKGLKLIAMTDHAPKMPGGTSFIYFLNLGVIPNFIEGVEILKGVEANIMNKDGKLDLSNNMLKRLDLVIASLHIPCIDPMTQEENTQAIINTMKNPYVNIIGHLGDPRYPFDVDKVIRCAKETNTIIEVNNASLSEKNSRFGGYEPITEIIKACIRENVLIAFGSDAHFCTSVGDFSNIEAGRLHNMIPEKLLLNTSVERLKKALRLKQDCSK